MTDNEINIAIAKACGWWGIEQEGMMRPPLSTSEYKMVPDYCHDLNAMHSVEAGMLGYEMIAYQAALSQVTQKNPHVSCWDLIHAYARQRAEAFLRVKGLWK